MQTQEQKFKIIDSTNNEAQRQLKSDNPPTHDFVIRADFQTEGRGQRGHTWTSTNAENLTFSYVFMPEKLEVQNQFMLSQTVSTVVADFLEKHGIQNVYVKWPNDVYVGMKKICGMLIENTLSGHYIKNSIIGVGVNINQTLFPANIPNPISMTQITGQHYNLDEMFYEMMELLRNGLSKISRENIPALKKKYMSKLLGLNKVMIYSAHGKIFKGIIKDVDYHGYITIENADDHTEQTYDFNEVNLIIPEQKKD